MLPSKLSRAAQRATAASPTATCYACLASHHTHQRRHSSSKASSSSADRYSNSKPAGPAAKAATSAPTEDQQAVSTTPETRPAQRSTKGRARIPRRTSTAGQDASKKVIPAEPVDQFAGLPSVPSVQNLSESDRSLSNFFSLHRPMSITHTFPPPTTPETFSKIFTPPPSREDPWANGNSAERRPEDVIYTLNTTIETLENSAAAAGGGQDEGVRWEIIHESASNGQQEGGVHHLDGHAHQQPRLRSLEELVAQFKPFRPPPPPVPFPEYESTPAKSAKGKEKKTATSTSTQERSTTTKPKRKTFTTTITVTESTYANGRKTYSASSSPIVALAENESLPSTQLQSPTRGLTRRERVRKLRAQASEVESLPTSTYYIPRDQDVATYRASGFGLRGGRVGRMYLISVKRQRKLKMKKHKYKKLMKRTRNLRRRLERN